MGGLLCRLNRQLEASPHRLQRAVIRAERAGVLARQGHLDEAKAEISWLRAEFDGCPHPEISVRLYLAEAWRAYFSDLSPEGREKVRRAYALARAAGLRNECALSAAWLAHMDYINLDFQAMARHVAEALALAGPQAHAARRRACLVVAEAYHLAGCMNRAQPWYAQARYHALAEEDLPALSALNHNLAWHRALQAVQAALWGGAPEAEARHALTSAAATHQFDTCRGVVALPSSIQVACALAYSVLGDHTQALAIFEAHAPQADAQGLLPLRPLVLAEMAWGCHHLGHEQLAHHYAQASVAALGFSQHADDLALAHGRLAQVFQRLGEPKRSASHARRARLNWANHQRVQSEVLAALVRVDPALGLST